MSKMTKVFENKELGKVRVAFIDDEPWFVGEDVAGVFYFADARKRRKALSWYVADEDKIHVVINDTGSNRKSKATLINETGLYDIMVEKDV